MDDYNGAVLFVDILGIGELTTSKTPIVEHRDFKAFNFKAAKLISNQLFCARLIALFRKNLLFCKNKDLNIAQLSDCAFLWSKNTNLLVETAKKLFMKNAESGVFARAGMSYGQVIEPDTTKTSLGRFICGDGVTRAAQLERMGKGARIFTDCEIGGHKFQTIDSNAFYGRPNISDYQIIDEFDWFSCPYIGEKKSEKITRLECLIKLLIRFQHCPRLRWNAGSALGRVHLGATIERLSDAVTSLCHDIDVPSPKFVIRKSHLYQTGYTDDQYKIEEFDKRLEMMCEWRSSFT